MSGTITGLRGYRERLPDRRPARTIDINWPVHSDRFYSLGVGYDEKDGTVREVFINWEKCGSELEAIIDDACIFLSFALQYGANIADVACSTGRDGDPDLKSARTRGGEIIDAPASSVLGQMCRIAANLQGELIKEIRSLTIPAGPAPDGNAGAETGKGPVRD